MTSSQSSQGVTPDRPWVFGGEAAQILGCSMQTLRRRSDSGEVPCHRPWPTAYRRYYLDDLQRIIGPAPEQVSA